MKKRLQVILAQAGIASRRKAETYITDGRVTVNGELITELGSKADPDRDTITVDGLPLGGPQAKTTILMHKPDMVVTTLSDPEGRETVGDIIASEPFRFVPAGRLDFHTEGALLLTTDGDLMNKLLHPRYHVPKIYTVKVAGRPSAGDLKRLSEGIELEDGPTRPAVVEVLEEAQKHTWLQIVVTEGRNRLVRRMCDAIHHESLRIVRTEVATVQLGNLKPGTYRYLSAQELTRLYKTAGIKQTPKLPERATRFGVSPLGNARRGRGRFPTV